MATHDRQGHYVVGKTEEERGVTLIGATEKLEAMVRELSGLLGHTRVPTDEEKQASLPTPAEQKVFVATHQIMCITSRLGEIHKVLTSLLSAIGD